MNQIFPISGMTCQHCVTRVQTLLSSVTGVSNVTVDLLPPRAHVEGDDIDLRYWQRHWPELNLNSKPHRLPRKWCADAHCAYYYHLGWPDRFR